jgi:hypothetical protein
MNEILTKVCFKCNAKKSINDFYKHKAMADGHLNKCKECNKVDVKKDYYRKALDENWLEKERIRGRERYQRLNYKERQKELNKNKFWREGKYKNLHKKLKTPKGFELHHWNYNFDFIEDVFLLSRKQHGQSHTYLKLDETLLIFRDLDNNLLDTREKHFNYLLSKGIIF